MTHCIESNLITERSISRIVAGFISGCATGEAPFTLLFNRIPDALCAPKYTSDELGDDHEDQGHAVVNCHEKRFDSFFEIVPAALFVVKVIMIVLLTSSSLSISHFRTYFIIKITRKSTIAAASNCKNELSHHNLQIN